MCIMEKKNNCPTWKKKIFEKLPYLHASDDV